MATSLDDGSLSVTESRAASLLASRQAREAAVVDAAERHLRDDRADQGAEHIPLRVPYVALRAEERVRGSTAGDSRSPLEELVAGAEGETHRRDNDEQPAPRP